MKFNVATQKDIPQLCELLNTLFSQEAEFAPNFEAQRKSLFEIITKSEFGDILVVRKESEIVGMVNLLYTISTALGGRVALLEDMVVSTSVRSQGMGSGLIGFAIQFAKEQGCKRITLLTDEDNIRAHTFYERLGFTKSPMIPFRLNLVTEKNG